MDSFGHSDAGGASDATWNVDAVTLHVLFVHGAQTPGHSTMYRWFRSRAAILAEELVFAEQEGAGRARRMELATAYKWACDQLEAHQRRRNEMH